MLYRTTLALLSLLITLVATPGTEPALAQEWAVQGGGASTDIAYDVATDAVGNSYVVGFFFDTATFGTGINEVTLTSGGSTDGFVAKYDINGTLLWVEQIEGSGGTTAIGVAVDGLGNAYVAGAFGGTITPGTGIDEVTLTSAGNSDTFLAKYDAAGGTLLWAVRSGGSGRDLVRGFIDSTGPAVNAGGGLAVDAAGNAYITGFFEFSATFGTGANEVILTDNGGGDVFLARYAADGMLEWAQNAGGISFDDGRDVALDAQGDVHLTGIYNGPATFGSGADEVVLNGPRGVFVAEYAADGTLKRAMAAGDDTGRAQVTAIGVDGSSNAYLIGFFEFFDITLGTGGAATTLANQGQEDAFLAKYDAAGTLLWAQSVGGSGQATGFTNLAAGLDLALDASGNVWTTGVFTGTASFGLGAAPLTLIDTGSPDAFVVQFDPSGAALQAQKIGGPSTSIVFGNAIADGSAVVAGDFRGTATFDGNAGRTLTSAGFNDAFAARYDPPLDRADLRVEKMVDDPSPTEGDPITFTVTLTNNGPADATGVQVTDPVPDGLTGVTANPGQGTYDANTGVWDVGALANGSSAMLTLMGTTAQSSPITNTATVSHSDQADPNAANNSADATSDPTLPAGSTLIVTNTNNSGVGSLRNALEFANATANGGGPDVITFAIDAGSDVGCNAGSGVCTISLATPLAAATDPVVIDGLTQDGASCDTWPATLKIVLNGSGVSAGNNGLTLSGGGATVRGLVIQAFAGSFDFSTFETTGGAGVFIDSDGNVVACNFFSTDVTGMTGGSSLQNEYGVRLDGGDNNTVGGTTVSQRNLISNSDEDGVFLEGGATGNVIAGNFIGTNATGMAALENENAGILFGDAPNNTVGGADHDAGVCNKACNLISGNDDEGILIDDHGADNITIQGNFIGTNLDGDMELPNEDDGITVDAPGVGDGADGHQIGGLSDPGVCSKACNLISGNDGDGIDIDDSDADNVMIQGNFIGTDADGTTDLPNQLDGIESDGNDMLIGGSTSGLGNLISGNGESGIDAGGDGYTVQGNLIGVAVDGTSPLGNVIAGLELSGDGHLIGGTGTGEGNVIAFNGEGGVFASSGTGNAILSNSIFQNTGLGIALSFGGTPNDPGDPDAGSNNLQNFPEIASASGSGSTLTINYTVPSATANSAYPIHVEFFLADTDNQEGKTLLGSDTYFTADAQNQKQAQFTPVTPVNDGEMIVATATDDDGNTSEFSAPAMVSGTAIPVELVSFEARLNGEAVALSWQTASETNNAGFEVERKRGGMEEWTRLGFVEGRGTTTAPQAYRFTDAALPFEATALVYRLRQIDYDGAFEYSPEVEVLMEAPTAFALEAAYPNPFNPTTTLRYALPTASEVKLAVYDVLGREVVVLLDGRQEAGRHAVVFEASGFPSGVYFYRLTAGAFTQARRVVLLK